MFPVVIAMMATLGMPLNIFGKTITAILMIATASAGYFIKKELNFYLVTQITTTVNLWAFGTALWVNDCEKGLLLMLIGTSLIVFLARFLFSIKAFSSNNCSKDQLEANHRFYIDIVTYTYNQLLIATSIIFIIGIIDISEMISLKWWKVSGPMATALIIAINMAVFYIINEKLIRETWIPLLNSKGQEVGRSTYSELERNKGYLPGHVGVIRILPVHDSMVYLVHKEPDEICPKGGYDTPFREVLSINTKPEKVAEKMVRKHFGTKQCPEIRYIMKYEVDKNGLQRYIWLFLIHLDSPEPIIQGCNPIESKWWPLEQIKDQPEDVIAPCMRMELPYITELIKLAKMMKGECKCKPKK